MVCSKCGLDGHNKRTCTKLSISGSSIVSSVLVEPLKILDTYMSDKSYINSFNCSTNIIGHSSSLFTPTSSKQDNTGDTISISQNDSDDPQPITDALATNLFLPNEGSDNKISPSEEQLFIINSIGEGNNVVADCVAGSGKTTTVLFLAKQYPDKKIVQVTYNKDLKHEVRKKADAHGISNLEIHTYHSLCVKYYNKSAHTNGPIRNVIERNTSPIHILPVYDIVVLDEVQDMNYLFYCLIKKLLRDCAVGRQPTLLLLGDRYQAINQYIEADSRFITLCSHIWERSFISASLTTSYRLTAEMASFVNDIMLGESRIRTVNSGPPVKYIIANTFNDISKIASIISGKLKEGNNASDIFILAPSIKSPVSPIRKLENKLVELGIPCYYPTSDDTELDNTVVAGKVVFCTFHQAKGRERQIVIVYSFDSSYFKFYSRDASPQVCPNTLYVAATRARKELIVIRSNAPGVSPLQFLQIDHECSLLLKKYVYLIGNSSPNLRSVSVSSFTEHTSSVTELTKHLKEHSVHLLNKICDIIFVKAKTKVHPVPIVSKLPSDKGMCEDISDINGLIIPGLYERQTRKMSTIEKKVSSSSALHHQLVKNLYSDTNIDNPTLLDYTKITVMYYSITEELLNKIAQIPRFDWLTDDAVKSCHTIMRDHIPIDSIYEEEIYIENYAGFHKYGKITIKGRLDIVTNTDIYEIKCVQELKIEHKLQLLIYAWLWNVSGKFEKNGGRRFKLLNIRSGELWELNTNTQLLKDAMDIILDNKYGKIIEKSDSIFIEECLKY